MKGAQSVHFPAQCVFAFVVGHNALSFLIVLIVLIVFIVAAIVLVLFTSE
jgi:hypothetical protein